jgi:uncharacterized secreted protein with C-terminal beta-propeller domain
MRAPLVVPLSLLALAVAAPAQAATARLKAFSSCSQLVSYARDGARRAGGGIGVQPRALPVDVAPIDRPAPNTPTAEAPTAAPAPAGQDFSPTNVQELGVDEPDVVKTDGTHIYAVADQTLQIVDVSGPAPVLVGHLPLDGFGSRLLLRGTRVLAIGEQLPAAPVPLDAPDIVMPGPASTTVSEIDVSDPAHPKLARTMTVPGRFVDARQNGGTARLVFDSSPLRAERLQTGRLHTFLRRTVLHSALTGRTYSRNLAPCGAIRHPRQFSGLDVVGILTVDLDRGMYSLDRDGVMAGAEVVYGSADSLYVASRRYQPSVDADPTPSGTTTTEIDRYDISDPDHTVYAAGGTVPGFVLNSYALSEYDGDLRVVTTERPPWWTNGQSSSTVTVLRQQGATLAPVGVLRGLGAGERVFAVRFMGDKGYVVTFHQIDPLHVIDLSDPAAPKLAGELDIPGYSSYLHPIGDTQLLGIGRDGAHLQASLFDVSDPSAPKRVSLLDLGAGESSVESDPHAFLYWPATQLAVLPLQLDDGFLGAVGVKVGAPLGVVGRVEHTPSGVPAADIERALVVGDKLYTVSYLGIGANALATLAPLGFTVFES